MNNIDSKIINYCKNKNISVTMNLNCQGSHKIFSIDFLDVNFFLNTGCLQIKTRNAMKGILY